MKCIRECSTVLWLALLCAIGHPAFADSDSEISVPIGQSQVLSVPDIERVALGDGEIAEVEIIEDREELVIFGRAAGYTDLRVWHADGSRIRYGLTVRAQTQATDIAAVRQIADRIEGVVVERAGSKVLLSGQPATPEAAQQVARLVALFPRVHDFTAPPAMPSEQTVRLQARFVEMSKASLRQIGIDWSERSPGIRFAYASDLHTNEVFRGDLGDFLPTDQLPLDIGEGNGYLGVGLNLSAMIDLLGERGQAKVIAEPMLSTLSGSSAQFQAGGEVPIPVQDEDGTTNVQFRDYGILLEAEPVVTDDARIRTRVAVEVSDIDQAVSVMGIPGFSVRTARTEMSGRSGETLMIAGLIDDQETRAVSQVPGLGDLPVIGELFRSRRFQRDETELVVMITPYLGRDTTAHRTVARKGEPAAEPDTPPQPLPLELPDP